MKKYHTKLFSRGAQKQKKKGKRSSYAAMESVFSQSAGATWPWMGAWTESRVEQVKHFKSAVYDAVTTIAESVASENLPNISYVYDEPSAVTRSLNRIRTKALTPLQQHEDLKPAENNHPLVRLLNDPNEPHVAYDLWYGTLLFLGLTGSAYWYTPLNRSTGLPEALWVIPSHWMWPVPSKTKIIDHYEMRPTEGTFLRRTFSADEIIHFRYENPISRLDGASPVGAIGQLIDVEEAVNTAQWHSYNNGSFPTLAVQFDQDLEDPDEETLRRIESRFISRLTGPTRSNKPFFLPPGVSVKPLTIVPNQMVFGEAGDRAYARIMRSYKVPPCIAGDIKNLTYGSLRASQMSFCLDEETECLTDKGWVNYKDLTTETLVTCYDKGRDCLVYEKPSKVIKFHYEGDMYRWEGEQLDILATPDHRMLVQRHKQDGKEFSWEVKRMSDFKETYTYNLRTAATLEKNPLTEPVRIDKISKIGSDKVLETREIDPLLWAEFVGYFVSEGHLDSREHRKGWRLGISQSAASPLTPVIEACLDKLPFKYVKCYLKPNNCFQWIISDRGLYTKLLEECGQGSKNKKIPEYIKSADVHVLRKVFDAAMAGDGNKWKLSPKASNSVYTTISKQLADDIHGIAVKLGYKAVLQERETTRPNRQSPVYSVRLSTRQTVTVVNSQRSVQENYSGDVWCLQVPTSFFVVRRNGKIHVTGNCQYCLKPKFTYLGQMVTEKLARRFSYDNVKLRVWFKDRTPDDAAALDNQIKTRLLGGAITPNEIRALYGAEPLPYDWADKPVMPTNMQSGALPLGGSHTPGTNNSNNPEMPALSDEKSFREWSASRFSLNGTH